MSLAVLALFSAGFIPLQPPAVAPAGGNADKKAFLNEYEPAAKKLEEFCRKLRLKARIVAKLSQGERSKTVQFMANGRMLRLEIIDPIRNGDALDSWVVVSHPSKSFQLVKKPNAKAFEAKWLVGDYFDYALTVMREGEVPFAPFTWQITPIAKFLNQPNVSIEKIEDVPVDGERLRKVAWKQVFPPVPKGKQTPPLFGWFLFDSSHGWVLRGYSFGTLRANLEYSKADDGIPLLKRVESWREGSNGSHSDVTIAEIQEIVRGEAPEKEFTLAAFGLPDNAEVKSLPPGDPKFTRPTMPDTGAELEAMRKRVDNMDAEAEMASQGRPWIPHRWAWAVVAALVVCLLAMAWVRLRHPP
jgi:hypothetical protein